MTYLRKMFGEIPYWSLHERIIALSAIVVIVTAMLTLSTAVQSTLAQIESEDRGKTKVEESANGECNVGILAGKITGGANVTGITIDGGRVSTSNPNCNAGSLAREISDESTVSGINITNPEVKTGVEQGG